MLLDRLAELHNPRASLINGTIENFAAERDPTEPPAPFTGATRLALDSAFRHNEVEHIVEDLEMFSRTSANASVKQWASDALEMLHMRSPTSLKVALTAIRRGKNLSLLDTLNMELKIATAFCSGASPDFITGVKTVIVDKIKTRPLWSPARLYDVSAEVVANFFEPKSPYLTLAPELTIPADLTPGTKVMNPAKFALPSEEDIGSVITGSRDYGDRMFGIQFEELLERFNEARQGKLGMKEKIYEVVQRKCELIDNADGNRVWLKWKH